MADKMRWRYGDPNPVTAAVDSATVIELGDILYQDTGHAKPASDQADQLSLAANQELLADNFLGVSMQRSPAGDTDPLRVATTGAFEFDCPSNTFELGDLIGVNEAGGGTELEDQQVIGVAASVNAIGRVVKRVPTANASVLVGIRSAVMTNGILAADTAP